RVENILNTTNLSSASTNASSDEIRERPSGPPAIQKQRIKLPEAPLPTFDGKYEGWLSFKNAFDNMIISRADLSDLDKLQYLKSALTGAAANKIKIFASDGIEFAKAWELLEKAYEVKRILISRHISLIMNLPTLEKKTTNGLSKLAHDTQQHVASLNALGVSVGEEIIVHIIETKLPKNTLEKWEATLERDEYPKLEQIYEFLYKTAVCASKRERSKSADVDRHKDEYGAKKRQRTSLNQAFFLNTSRNCIACKIKQHPLYLCTRFKQLIVPKRIELVRSAKVCYNCLRSHRDSPCKFSSCTICHKRHNTLLHLDKFAHPNKSDATQSETAKSG
ncbi:PREDICTED: uncharacterized protein LOC105570979, partial [Vollenhovia emeryi]|uniref:uncharacterized protein LOC105570979 n=1 Tax=Vollenhovia emeryi TaxID=411798 RepID=UPI0005F45821